MQILYTCIGIHHAMEINSNKSLSVLRPITIRFDFINEQLVQLPTYISSWPIYPSVSTAGPLALTNQQLRQVLKRQKFAKKATMNYCDQWQTCFCLSTKRAIFQRRNCIHRFKLCFLLCSYGFIH